MQKQLKKSPFENQVNSFGVQSSVSKNGVLLSYALTASEDIEIYYPDLHTALNALNVACIDAITAFNLFDVVTPKP